MTAHAQAFMMVGTETTATLLSGLTILLLKHPHYMRRLQGEVRALEKDELDLENLARLPFLNVCLQEALRIYPLGPIAFFRITPKGGNMICGECIPEGVSISQLLHELGIRAYSNHHTRPALPSLTSLPTITPLILTIPTPLSPTAGSLAPTTTAIVEMQ